jgi:hypothetical protein
MPTGNFCVVKAKLRVRRRHRRLQDRDDALPRREKRMRRLMSMVQTKRFDPAPLLTHSFKRRDGVLKVAIRP